jgi:hypothetical protein
MSRNRNGTLQSAIDRVKAEVANYRNPPIRTIGPPRNSVGVTTAILVFLLVASLPIWRELPPGINAQLFGEQPSILPLQSSVYVVGFAVALGLNTIKALYNVRIKWADQILRYVWLSRHNPGHIAFSAVSSYALSIWAFALAYNYLQHAGFAPQPFKPFENEGFFSWVYFSIVTMATVGFGEITPQTDWARAVVSMEIVLGVAYQVFFFSIVASLVRERGSA